MSQLATLDSQLQSRYARSPLNPDVTWSLGSAVAAFYDDCLYRAKIVGFDDDGIEVLRTAVLKCVCWIFWQREAQFLSRRSRLSDPLRSSFTDSQSPSGLFKLGHIGPVVSMSDCRVQRS